MIAKATRFAKGVARSIPLLADAAEIVRLETFKHKARRFTTPQLSERLASTPTLTLQTDRVVLALERALDVTQADEHWDARALPLQETELHRALTARFVGGKTWDEVSRGALHAVLTPGIQDKLERLHRESRAGRSTVGISEGDVRLGIGRHGDLICIGGLEALCLVQILGVDRIEATVTLRHKKWQEFVKQVLSYASEKRGRIYNVIDHPDLCDIPAIHGWSRLEMIQEALTFSGGRALDIGCHWGFYCHQLERSGFDCTGVELERRHVYFARKIRRAVRGSYRVIHGSLFDIDESQEFDLVIALYIFHHLVKTAEVHERLVRFLANLKVRAMIFGSHNHDQDGMQTAYRNYTSDQWVDFLLEKSALRKARIIGTENYGTKRDLFLLEA